MAKRPDDPNAPKPGDRGQPKPGSDSGINLNTPADGVENSGIPVIEWASLDETPAPPYREGEPVEMLPESVVGMPGDPTSQVDLGASPPVAEDDVVMADLLGDSGLDLRGAIPAAPPTEDSAIDFGVDAVIPGSASGNSAIDLGGDDVNDSGIDLVDIVPAVESGSSVSLPPGESGIDLIAEDVILEEPIVHAGGSSRDLIAEGLESGVDLLGTQKKDKHEDALEDFLAQVGNEDPSSSVDLGSVHSLNVFEESGEGGKPAAEIDLDTGGVHPGSEPSLGDIDLGGMGEDQVESGEMSMPMADLDEAPKAKKGKKKASVEVDEAVADVEVDDAKKSKKKKKKDEDEGGVTPAKPKKSRPLLYTALGAMLGTAACLGAWTFGGLEPVNEYRDQARGLVGMENITKPVTHKGGGTGNGGVSQPAAVTPVQIAERVKGGDFDKISDADLGTLTEDDATHLVTRADAVWLKYVKKQRGKNLKADAPEVQRALKDLTTAVGKNSADALFLRGQIHEMTGNAAAAEADYKAGAEQFKADAAQKNRFDAALLAMEFSKKTAALPADLSARALAMALIKLQVLGGDGDEKEPPEAGYAFWKAIRAARENKYADALTLLDESRKNHDERRFIVLRKPQNPNSDPREEIFLRAADELKAYWALKGRLSNPGAYLAADNKMRDPAIDGLLKQSEEGLAKTVGAKLFKDKPVATVGDLEKLFAEERKDRDEKLTKANEDIVKANEEVKKTAGDLKKTADTLKSTADLLTDSVKREKDLQASLDAANAALAEVAGAVNVKFKDAKTNAADLVKEVKEATRLAKIADPKGTIRRLEREQVADRAKLKDRWEPVEMLPFWLAVLEGDRSRKDLHAAAMKDVRRVQGDAEVRAGDKAKATAIEALVLRNEDRYAEALTALKTARDLMAKDREGWLKPVNAAIEEVSNPGAYFARRAEEQVARNRPALATALLKKAIDSLPDGKGPLYARRAQIALDDARSRVPLKNTLDRKNAVVVAAKADAQAAATEGVAEGHYLLGRIAEETGQINDAITNYRAAVAAHRSADDAASRYRAALARALLKSRAGEMVPPRPVPPPDRVGKLTPGREELNQFATMDTLTLLMTLALQAPGLPSSGPNVREAEKLADEIIKMGDKASFDARATALAVKGLYTRAVNTYLEGLREKGLLAPGYANGLLELIDKHPALSRPESLTVPEPLAGEKAYASGVNLFTRGKYADAEREFLSAVEHDNGDARYFYYLGLTRLMLGKRDGYEDLDAAARLERLGRPGSAAVSQALERIQGSPRKMLNEIRRRPVKDRPR